MQASVVKDLNSEQEGLEPPTLSGSRFQGGFLIQPGLLRGERTFYDRSVMISLTFRSRLRRSLTLHVMKKRLDVLVVELGLLPSRQVAQTAIMDGGVIVDGVKVTKPGAATKEDAKIEILGDWQEKKYVSRGGFKLEKALAHFKVSVENKICLDVGASTGGFTDCLLKHGASLVYAIDVGYGQIDWSLRTNEQVIVKERMNARYATASEIYAENSEFASVAVADLSFISILKVLPACVALLAPQHDIIALIKPQFEAGKELVGKGGVVRDAQTHVAVLQTVVEQAATMHLQLRGLTYSPIKGPAGNIEFLAWWSNQSSMRSPIDIEAVVDSAHTDLHGAQAEPHSADA
jgi:23S rRNA (cytidine1920-2'-O)/16S rRNA (cytidine1409-2'-O)-methyltransferase